MGFDIARKKPGGFFREIIAEIGDYDIGLKIVDFLNQTEYGEFEIDGSHYFWEEIDGLEPNCVELRDCVNMSLIVGKYAILNDGKLIGFEQEEIPVKTGNQDGD